jgi:hypothetical protein
MQGWRLPLAGALALSLGLAPMAPVAAAPAAMSPGLAKAEAGSTVLRVHRYRHFHRHHGHRGRNLGIGLGIGIIGGIIASEAYRSAPGYAYDEEVYDATPPSGDPRAQCAREFRSFEWDTGFYTTYSGEKKLCPYLR